MSVSIICDLRARFGPARDQGPRPTCLAFAASDAHASLFQPFRPFSAEYLYYHAVQRMAGRDPKKGIHVRATGDALLSDGQPLEADWPYKTTLPSELSRWIPPATCKVFRRRLPVARNSFDQICGSLDAVRPVVVGLRISESFYMPNHDGIVARRNPDPDTGSHAVIAVGYGITTKESSILIRNSWGPTWGLDGHAFLEKSYLENRLILTSIIS